MTGDDRRPSDATLCAYVDGELDAADRAAVAAAAAADPVVAGRLREHEVTREQLRAAFPVPPDPGPVPPAMHEAASRLAAALAVRAATPEQSRVVPLPARRRPAARWHGAYAALAASVVLGLAVLLLRGGDAADPLALTAQQRLGTDHRLHAVLEGAASGRTVALDRAADGAAARVVLTFRAGDGRWCREFEVVRGTAASAAVACRDGDEWRVEAAASGPAPVGSEGGYAAASGATPAGVDAAVARLMNGDALSAADEAGAIEGGWR